MQNKCQRKIEGNKSNYNYFIVVNMLFGERDCEPSQNIFFLVCFSCLCFVRIQNNENHSLTVRLILVSDARWTYL